MADNIENKQVDINKFEHQQQKIVGCETGVHDLQIKKMLPGEAGLTEVHLVCGRCLEEVVSYERLNINDLMGGENAPEQPPEKLQSPQTALETPQAPIQPKPTLPPPPQPETPEKQYKDSDDFWEAIKEG